MSNALEIEQTIRVTRIPLINTFKVANSSYDENHNTLTANVCLTKHHDTPDQGKFSVHESPEQFIITIEFGIKRFSIEEDLEEASYDNALTYHPAILLAFAKKLQDILNREENQKNEIWITDAINEMTEFTVEL